MRLILREEVENLGKRGEIVNVARGYARNYLLPRRLAVEITDENLRLIEKERKVYETRLAKEREDAENLASSLSGLKLSFRRKVHGEGQELYGSVSVTDVADAVAEKGFKIEKRKIQLDEPFKTLGEFSVVVRLHPQVEVSIPVIVEKEKEEE
ncbi:MAG TPA: 50S ribosomal protein L9 [Vicinamibacteria bacterium]|nr:50S ribosomal protein L9 [Vicinamibacteria bacterium]